MYNKIIVMGRIVNDLELKQTQNGAAVLSFRVAVDRSYQAKGEERKSDFFNVVAWRNSAEFIAKYFGKGKLILIDGELQNREYTDKDNNKRTATEIIVNSASFTGESKGSTTPTDVINKAQANGASVSTEDTGEEYPF